MSTFCLLAYIPCIILVIWLFIELRKYVIVTKNLRRTKKVWKKVQAQREKKKSEDQLVETIPPPPPPEYASDYNPAPGADSYSRLDEDYEYPRDDFRDGGRGSRFGPGSRRTTRGRHRQEYYDRDYDYERELRASRRRKDAELEEYDREPYAPVSHTEPRLKHRRGSPKRRLPPQERFEYDDYDPRPQRRPKPRDQSRKRRRRDYPDRYSHDGYYGTEDVSDDVDWE